MGLRAIEPEGGAARTDDYAANAALGSSVEYVPSAD